MRKGIVMGLTLLLEGVTVATSVGLGCGTCCGSGAGMLLTGYVMTHARDSRQSMIAFLSFYLGKIASVAALCLVASLVGQSAFLQSDLFASTSMPESLISSFSTATAASALSCRKWSR